MPKIIEDVEEKIFQAVIDIVGDDNFENISMQMIAEQTEIAVGTLYNYFASKEELILHVLNKSWQETFSKLDKVIKEEMGEQEKLEKFVLSLYRDIAQRKAIGRELIKSDILEKDSFSDIKFDLKTKFNTLLDLLEEEDHVFQLERERLIDIILVTVIKLASGYKSQEKNISFLKNFLKKLVN